MDSPRIYLAIDNCFASKRWTLPSAWSLIVRDLGVRFVEASADNECDPLYTTKSYLRDWIADFRKAEGQIGVEVANLYSGHGTYSTLGLGHTDRRIRDRMENSWIKVMVRNAGAERPGPAMSRRWVRSYNGCESVGAGRSGAGEPT